MKPSTLLPAALALLAANSSTTAFAAPIKPRGGAAASKGEPSAVSHLVKTPSDQAPLLDHAAPTPAPLGAAKGGASTSLAQAGTGPVEDFVETIVEDGGRENDDLVLSVKASRVRETLLGGAEDSGFKIRFDDLPDRPIDDPTRWMAAKGLLGK